LARIEPEEQDFDPDDFSAADAERSFAEGIALFNGGDYHAAHEAFERCWLANEAGDADFFKGLVQASICLMHLGRDNVEGARKLHTGHRRLLAAYMPSHLGLDVGGLLASMRRTVGSGQLPASEAAPKMARTTG
tara:strand:- start:503 stop:904 length:402 start_codon:yes stop_codon:yes gene_type:complete